VVISAKRGDRSATTGYVLLAVVILFGLIVVANLVGTNSKGQPEQGKPAAPIPTQAEPAPAKRTPKEERAWESRNLDRAALDKTFLQAGVDVVVGNLVSEGSDDNRSLFIKGDAVNRPFVYNFLDPDAVRLLKRDGFIKVTFMRHSMGDWVAEYDVQSGKITWD
jgi:hypothetical protein